MLTLKNKREMNRTKQICRPSQRDLKLNPCHSLRNIFFSFVSFLTLFVLHFLWDTKWKSTSYRIGLSFQWIWCRKLVSWHCESLSCIFIVFGYKLNIPIIIWFNYVHPPQNHHNSTPQTTRLSVYKNKNTRVHVQHDL